MPSFVFNDTATTEIYTLSLHELFRSVVPGRWSLQLLVGEFRCWFTEMTSACVMRSEEHTSELQSRLHLACRLLFLMIRRPPRSTLFPYTSSSDLSFPADGHCNCWSENLGVGLQR